MHVNLYLSLPTIQFTLRLFSALLLGALVGLERQWRQRMAGTRTNALVAAGASAFVMCGLMMNDPTAQARIVSYVVSGVGFLGAGVIFKEGGNVRGLNTAATIWCSAAIGALSGLGAFTFALVLALAVLATNLGLRPLAYRFHPALPEPIPIETVYEIKLVCTDARAAHIRTLLLSAISQLPVALQSIRSDQEETKDLTEINAEVKTAGRNNEVIEKLVMRLSMEEEVDSITWSIAETSME